MPYKEFRRGIPTEDKIDSNEYPIRGRLPIEFPPGTYYESHYRLWEARGKIPYYLFRSRLWKYPGDYDYALGLAPHTKNKRELIL